MIEFTWVDNDGDEISLSAPNDPAGINVRPGVVGIDVPRNDTRTAQFLSADGGTRTGKRKPSADIVLPITLRHPTRVRTTVADLGVRLDKGGSLRTSDGTNIRTLQQVEYISGLEETSSVSIETKRQTTLLLRALDPWWYGESKVAALDAPAYDASTPFDDASTAFDANSGFDGSSAVAVAVAGAAAAFPVTTIHGPFTNVQLGVGGGQTLALANALADGDVITIDTRPGRRGPRLNGGDVDWSLLTSSSRLWGLARGVVVINSSATGDGANSLIEVAYQERWLTP